MAKQHIDLNNRTILVTGSPGFIGAYLVLRLLKELTSGTVISFDSMNDYYDVSLKEYRLREIEKVAEKSPVKHIFIHGNLANKELVDSTFKTSTQETCLREIDYFRHKAGNAVAEGSAGHESVWKWEKLDENCCCRDRVCRSEFGCAVGAA